MHAAEENKRARTASKATSRRDHRCSPLAPLLQLWDPFLLETGRTWAAADRTIMLRRTSKRVQELYDRAVSPIHQLPVHTRLTYPSPGPLPPPEHLQLRSCRYGDHHHPAVVITVSLKVAFYVSQVDTLFTLYDDGLECGGLATERKNLCQVISGPFLGGCCDRSAISPEEQEKFLQGPPGETQEEWHKQPAFMHRYRSITIFHGPIHDKQEDAKEIIYLVLVQATILQATSTGKCKDVVEEAKHLGRTRWLPRQWAAS